MKITTLTSREFNQNTSDAKKAAEEGPVFITDRGRPAHVLLNIQAYRDLANDNQSIVDLLASPLSDDIDIDVPARTDLPRVVDFS